jgi:hypothetical protein
MKKALRHKVVQELGPPVHEGLPNDLIRVLHHGPQNRLGLCILYCRSYGIRRAMIATSVHRLYIRPPGKHSLELLRQYTLFILAQTVCNVLKF